MTSEELAALKTGDYVMVVGKYGTSGVYYVLRLTKKRIVLSRYGHEWMFSRERGTSMLSEKSHPGKRIYRLATPEEAENARLSDLANIVWNAAGEVARKFVDHSLDSFANHVAVSVDNKYLYRVELGGLTQQQLEKLSGLLGEVLTPRPDAQEQVAAQ